MNEVAASSEAVPRVGVYVCHCGKNIADTVDVKKVSEFASSLPNVVIARDYVHVCDEVGQDTISRDIKEQKLNRVVVAACSPKVHEVTFRRTLAKSGLNPYLLEVGNIREQCSWVHIDNKDLATEKAKDLVIMAVSKALLLRPLEAKEIETTKSTLVIGGGIAGVQAALDLADSGIKVHLVERASNIGGRMAQWGKVFPTMDCAACILMPKLVNVVQHPNITLYTHSEVKDFSGSLGNFKVKIVRKPKYVDEEKCTGCGTCAQKCPVKVPNEFDFGLGQRKAIYIPSPNAIPQKYTIDTDHCLYFTKGVCKVCQKFCTSGAINYEQQPQTVDIQVGTVVVATGYDPFDPSGILEYGFGKYDNVITGPMVERMADAMGPTGGKIIRLSDKKPPKKVAFLQCVGSRDEKLRLAYCSRVCCMYALKDAMMLKEEDPSIEATIFYIDIRAFGKGYEEFYVRGQERGVKFVRGKVSSIVEEPDTKRLRLRYEDTLLGRTIVEAFDLVVLSVGQLPRKEDQELGKLLGLPRGIEGFFMEAHPKLRPNDTVVDGIYLAGSAQYPKDITDAVAQASGAASRAAISLQVGKVQIEPVAPTVDENYCGGCGICVGTCTFNALKFDKQGEKRVVRVDESLCKGCGSCVAACPLSAIKAPQFTDQQIAAQVKALLRPETLRR
nr:CoB--CoM heterodisulfide reductase iron-sulfur subunit A family protein [Candidatus Njordarchaeota archaeon]